MAKKQEQEEKQVDPKSGVPICQYCQMNMRCVGSHLGRKNYVCKQDGCGRGNAFVGSSKAPAYDNEGFSARP